MRFLSIVLAAHSFSYVGQVLNGSNLKYFLWYENSTCATFNTYNASYIMVEKKSCLFYIEQGIHSQLALGFLCLQVYYTKRDMKQMHRLNFLQSVVSEKQKAKNCHKKLFYIQNNFYKLKLGISASEIRDSQLFQTNTQPKMETMLPFLNKQTNVQIAFCYASIKILTADSAAGPH